MSAVTFDKFEYIRKLKESGINEKDAEIQADALSCAISSMNVASKDDIISQTRWYIGALIGIVGLFSTGIILSTNSKIESLDSTLNAKIESLNTKIVSLDSTLNAKIESLNTKMDARFDIINSKLDNISKK